MNEIDIETCARCGGAVRVIASIEDAAVIKQILAHRERGSKDTAGLSAPGPRAASVTGVTMRLAIL